jgi:hypothetical protein
MIRVKTEPENRKIAVFHMCSLALLIHFGFSWVSRKRVDAEDCRTPSKRCEAITLKLTIFLSNIESAEIVVSWQKFGIFKFPGEPRCHPQNGVVEYSFESPNRTTPFPRLLPSKSTSSAATVATMKSFAALCFLAFVSATPEPVITPLAQLHVRQDDALVGWLSTSGASARELYHPLPRASYPPDDHPFP